MMSLKRNGMANNTYSHICIHNRKGIIFEDCPLTSKLVSQHIHTYVHTHTHNKPRLGFQSAFLFHVDKGWRDNA